MRKIKLYAILGIIVIIIGGIVARFLNNHSFVSDKLLAKKDTAISQKGREILVLQKQMFSVQQDLDLCDQNKLNRELVIEKLTKERNEARAEAKTIREAIEHYEANGLIRFFVFDSRGLRKGCYREEFKKPDNICK